MEKGEWLGTKEPQIIMRYIRTKSGIEQANYGEDFNEGKSYFYKSEYRWEYGDVYHKVKVKTYAKNGITRISNTIKELCDELVFDNIYHSRMTPNANTKENQEVIKSYLKQNIVCYGAIWTDKGLIYVAKMNEKGELELL